MSAVSRWAEDLPQPIASILVVLAMAWKQPFIIYCLHQKGEHLGKSLSKPDLDRWLDCYQAENLFSGESFKYIEPILPNNLDSTFFGSLTDKKMQAPDDAQLEAFYANLIDGHEFDFLPDEDVHLFPLEILFFMLVTMPCLVIHGKEPNEMLEEARSGDLHAMCNIIRIDRSVIFDIDISAHIHAWTLNFKTVHLKRIGEAFGQGLPKVSTKKIKLLFAQYVYDAAHHAGLPLKAPKIRQLFDAIYQDSTGNQGAPDPDLVEASDDTFYRSLNRNKKPLTKQAHHRDN